MSATLNSISAPLESPLPEARVEDAGGIIGEHLGSAGDDLVTPARDWSDAAARGLIVIVAVVLAWYTWARWGDFQVDCGRELYVPTEILRGKLIYRDFFYSYGPLAPYLCALLIAIFGPHLVVLYLFGITIAIGCAIMLYELGAMLEGRAAGLTAALALLFVGVAPNSSNYILPYSYAATIGLLLSLICVWFTLRHIFDQNGYDLLKAGFAASMAILCKPELGVTCYLILAFVMVMEAIQRRSIRALLDGVVAFAPGVMLWVAIYGWFFWTLTPSYMLDANWIGMPGTPGQPNAAHLYRLTGQRFIPREMLALTIGGAASLLVWFLLAKARQGPRNVILAIAAMIAVTSQFGPPSLMMVMLTAILVFPLGTFFIGCAFTGYAIYKLYQTGGRQYLSEAAFGIFALLIAVRVLASVVPYGYSVYCATTLFLVFVIVLSRCIKAATPALSVDRQRRLVNYLLAAEVLLLALLCIPPTTERSARLETSWGEIYLTPTDASAARQMIDFISEQKRNGRKVAVLPEAPMLYALTGTEAPNRWYTLLPGYFSPSGEDAYIADLNRAAPDYILLTARNSIEYGASYFGIDYDQKIYHWIESNYRIAGKFGRFNREEHNRVFAALLYQRLDPSKTIRTAE
jgi:hypothetical protein